ncbi:hypothetical protein SAICODRAFT_30131 [Saitoella complicata NRRL Y-17804]|nr:uncharacterized protein SAICODRAFT_30131 [Saitoella complicata NRRL Y-17804]ODQ53436.1 hypothetical protein SAICODRAFT_30131 [Saitoella complicata NRRL Y-17804]
MSVVGQRAAERILGKQIVEEAAIQWESNTDPVSKDIVSKWWDEYCLHDRHSDLADEDESFSKFLLRILGEHLFSDFTSAFTSLLFMTSTFFWGWHTLGVHVPAILNRAHSYIFRPLFDFPHVRSLIDWLANDVMNIASEVNGKVDGLRLNFLNELDTLGSQLYSSAISLFGSRHLHVGFDWLYEAQCSVFCYCRNIGYILCSDVVQAVVGTAQTVDDNYFGFWETIGSSVGGLWTWGYDWVSEFFGTEAASKAAYLERALG